MHHGIEFFIFIHLETMQISDPLVHAMVPSIAEYASGNAVFVGKIKWLSSSFGSMRRTRGDGNCFYRAFAYAYLEGLLLDFNLDECKRSVMQCSFPQNENLPSEERGIGLRELISHMV
jgi:hypothetical protein